jgi:mannose-6-phosphate isomerase-like protein (cupin superfamily)
MWVAQQQRSKEKPMTQPRQGYALTDQEGQAIWFFGTLSTLKATSEQTQQAYSLHVDVIPPGAEPPAHLHRHQDEAFFVLDGAISVHCGNQTWRGSAGTFIFLPQSVPHAFRVEGNRPVTMLVINSPGGVQGFEHFVEEMGTPAQAFTLPATSAPDLEKLHRLAAKYDIEFVELP